MREKIEKIQSFLTLLIPIVLITGNFLPDLIISIISILFLFLIFQISFDEYKIKVFFYSFFFFYFYLVICSLLSANISFSISASLPYIRFFIFSFAFLYLLKNFPKLTNYLFWIFLFCLTILSLDILFQFLNDGKNIFGWESGSAHRYSSFFKDEYIAGSYISKGASIILLLYLIRNKSLIDLKILIYLIFLVLVVTLTGDRIPLLSIILLLILSILFSDFKISYKIYFFVSLISILILIFYLFPTSLERVIIVTYNQISQLKIPFLPFSPHHELHFISAYKMFQDHFFLGVGPNLFREYCSQDVYLILDVVGGDSSCSTHPHNYYFQTLAELGIIGFAFLLTLFIFFVVKFFVILKKIIFIKNNNSNFKIQILSIFSIILLIAPIFPSRNFYNQWDNVLNYIIFGLYLLIRIRYENK